MAESFEFRGFVSASELQSANEEDERTKPKRRRIHLDAVKCRELAETAEGSKILCNPFEASTIAASKKHVGLAPRPRSRRGRGMRSACATVGKKLSKEENDATEKTSVEEPQQSQNAFDKLQSNADAGFTSASDILRLSSKSSGQVKTSSKSKSAASTDDRSQGSILRFLHKMPRNTTELSSSGCSKEGTVTQSSTSQQASTANTETFESKKKLAASQGSNSAKKSSRRKTKKAKASHTTSSLWKPKLQKREYKHGVSDVIEISSDDDFECSEDFAAFERKRISKTYGLVSVPTDEQEETYFEQIPPDIQELIFCQLPVLDLFLNCSRVCKAWRDLISSPRFIPWKKLHFKLMKGAPSAMSQVDALLEEPLKQMYLNPHQCLLATIRRLKTLKPITAGMEHMLRQLSKHPKYGWAKALLEERCPDCVVSAQPSPWSIVAALCIIADRVADVSCILEVLLGPHSECTSIEVIECLYAMAVLLLRLKLIRLAGPWSTMHYRVYYALYLFENASMTTRGMLQEAMEGAWGQQSITQYGDSCGSVRLTHEQLRIVKHHPLPGEIIKIVAFAGTGKTTTLVQYTQYRPNMKFLLVVYNKSVQTQAEKLFPKNVTCKTGHSLAYGHVGWKYRQKLGSGLKVYGVTQWLQPRKGENLFVRAKFVIDTLNNFMASSDAHITSVHVPNQRLKDDGTTEEIPQKSKMLYADDAEYLWGRMITMDDKMVNMTHDGYLKLFQLRAPKLTGYDVILIDEAQDLTPAVIDILMQQSQPKILVGDPHQQIYSFRGAVSAMDTVPASHIFYLTQSFRFGPEIAYVAASCLEVLKGERHKTIVGHGHPGKVTGEQVGQLCIISRCNYTLFNEAVKKCCYSVNDSRVAFVGGTDGFGFPMLLDMYALTLSAGERARENLTINNKLIRSFHSLVELEKYAKQTSDMELLGKLRILHTHSSNLPVLIHKIQSKCVRDLAMADVIFSTAHKAKGLEFSTVRVTDDFCQTGYNNLNPSAISPDEKNLLYVAVTRAKRALQMTGTVLQVLARNGEELASLVCSEEVKKQQQQLVCLLTGEEFSPKALTLQQHTIVLSGGSERKGGLFSPKTLAENFNPYAQLCGDDLPPTELL